MRKGKRVSGLMVGALVAAALSACAVAAYAQESKQESPGVTGVWTGKSSARCAMMSDRTRTGYLLCRGLDYVASGRVGTYRFF
jgi:hypothetical protein